MSILFRYVVRFFLFSVLSLATLSVSALDLNQASVVELRQIKGIGPKTAENIISERSRGGPFDSLQDLADRVKGIGPKRLDSLEASGLKVGASTSTNATTSSATTTQHKEN